MKKGTNLLEDFRKFYKSRSRFNMTVFDSMSIKGFSNPYILEERTENLATLDIFSKMLTDRIIFFNSDVNDDTCGIVVAQMLYLDSIGEKEIKLYINSPGGSVYAGYGVIDTMSIVKSDVRTLNYSMCASMGAMILLNGTKGKRSSLTHARTMLHEPSGGCKGKSVDIEVTAQEIVKLREELFQMISDRTGQDIEKVKIDCSRDYWLTAKEALDYGIIDEIIDKK